MTVRPAVTGDAATTGLLIGHGSPDPRHAMALRHLAACVSEQLASLASDVDCEIAFLDHDQPLLANWLTDRPSRPLRAIGLLLASGYHAQIDIPQALAAGGASRPVTNLGTLSLDGWLFGVLDRRVGDVGGTEGASVVLVAAGSTQEAARKDLRTVCDEWQRRRGGAVLPAAVTGPDPRPQDVVSTLDVAASEVVVLPFMLAPGALADRARAAAALAGVRCAPTITTE
ncbi:MAG: sirohydrochlorin chelatase, partial [Actinomycetes bacterium]